MRSRRIGRPGRMLVALGLSPALALSVLATAGASPQPDPPAAQAASAQAAPPAGAAPGGGPVHTVTLVTGDVVQVTGEGANSRAQVVTDVPPRGDVQFMSSGDELFAVPGAAGPMLAAGQLDVRLFNLSLLVRDGFTDDKAKQLPVIVDYRVPDGAQPPSAPVAGAQVRRRLPAAGAVALGMDKKSGATFWSAVTRPSAKRLALDPGIKKVWLDGKVRALDDVSRVTIGADRAWAAGYNGTGVPVAVLDTGVDANHHDLAGRVAESKNFVPAGQPGGDSTTDRYGHGTHVASIIAGSGEKSAGKYAGVAPGSTIFNGKVLDDFGSGEDSWIIAGMEWAASKAKIVNMSLGGCCTDGSDPLAQALNEISRRTGALFVTAAGNNGPGNLVVGTPAVADEALAVSATTREGTLKATYSSRGPRRGDYSIKPEIAAPGSDIWAASANGDDTVICRNQPTACPGDGYMRISGTSMASPHVAAAAAIVRQQHPDWTAQQVRDALTSTAKPYAVSFLQGYIWEQGAGVVDLSRAVTQTLDATGVVNLGVDQDPAGTQAATITYTNRGDAPVTLDLRSQFWRPSTGDADRFRRQQAWTPPEGAVRIEPAQVTVPAGGTSTATLTVDNSKTPYDNLYGRIDATGPAGVSTTTVVSFSHDFARHKLVVDAPTKDGGAPDPYMSGVWARSGKDGTVWRQSFGQPGDWWYGKWVNVSSGEIADLPTDTYRIYGGVVKESDHTVMFAGWTVQLTADTTLRIDPAAAKEVRIRTDRPTVNSLTNLGYTDQGRRFSVTTEGAFRTFQLLGPQSDGVTTDYTSTRVPQPLWLRTADGRARVPAVMPSDWAAIQPGHNRAQCYTCRIEYPVDGRIVLADAGDGSAAALDGKDLRGKVALIRERQRPADGLIDDGVLTAVKAGAVGVVYAVEGGSPFRLAAWDHDSWVAVVTAEAGAELAGLAAARPARLVAESNVPASFDYQVSAGPIPPNADGVYPVSDSELATVTTRFHASYDGQPGSEQLLFGPSINRVPMGRLPLVRTEYVMPGAEARSDSHCANWGVAPTPAACQWAAGGLRPALVAGQRVERDLMRAPMVPQAVLDHPLAVNRDGRLAWDHRVGEPFLGDGRGLGGLSLWDNFGDRSNKFTHRTRVHRDGQQLCDAAGFLAAGCAIDQAGSYRIALDTAMSTYPLSNRTSTEWSLDWDPAAGAAVPLVLARYDLPVDLNNRVAARPHRAPIRIGYQPGGPAAPAGWSVKVWATYDDGASWRPVYDGRTGPDGRVAPMLHPPKRHNGFVGLRVEADDGRGNGIDQTVIRAYYLG